MALPLVPTGFNAASPPHNSMIRYEDSPYYADTTREIMNELECLETGTRAGHCDSILIDAYYIGLTEKRSANVPSSNPIRRYYSSHIPNWGRPPQPHLIRGPIYNLSGQSFTRSLPSRTVPLSNPPLLDKPLHKSLPETACPSDVWPDPSAPEAEDVTGDADEDMMDIDSDDTESTLAASPGRLSDCESTTDVEDSDDEYNPSSRKASPASTVVSCKHTSSSDVVHEQAPSRLSPDAETPPSKTPSRIPTSRKTRTNKRAQKSPIKLRDGRSSPAQSRRTNLKAASSSRKATYRCLVRGCKESDRLWDEHSRDRHMNKHFIPTCYCSVCKAPFSATYSHSRHLKKSTKCATSELILLHPEYWRTCMFGDLERPTNPDDPLLKTLFDQPDEVRACECGSLTEAQKAERRRLNYRVSRA